MVPSREQIFEKGLLQAESLQSRDYFLKSLARSIRRVLEIFGSVRGLIDQVVYRLVFDCLLMFALDVR